MRFVLPTLNFCVALPLVIAGQFRLHSTNTATVPTELLIAYVINAPAAVLRYVAMAAVYGLIPRVCGSATQASCYWIASYVDPCVFLIAVVCIWYVVGLEIDWRGSRKRSVAPERRVARIAGDTLLVAFGVFCITLGVLNWPQHRAAVTPATVMQIFSYATWGILVTSLYGRDLFKVASQWQR
jgi:hypothetical protein